MRRKAGVFCMFLGTVLVGLALSLFLYNLWDSKRAGDASEEVLTHLKENLEASENPEPKNPLAYPETGRIMTVVNIDGYDYIGYLSIPSIDLSLPVMAEWSYEGLKIAPGRYAGSVFTDDLVIAGHNYQRHFSPVKWLETGTEVDFTDMDNVIWRYEVISVETLQPTQVEDMITETENDKWDLTLFTCTTDGQTRCAVRCERKRTEG